MTFTSNWAQPDTADRAGGSTPAFGAAEVGYALSLADGEARRQAEKFLQVDHTFVTPQVAALGASSLLARGELSVDGDDLVPHGAVRLLIAVLQAAVRWTEIALVNENGAEAAVYLQSPELSVFLQPAAMNTWVMVVKAPGVEDSALLKELIDNNVARHPLGTAYFGTETLGSDKGHFFVRAAAADLWDVADAEGAGDGLADGIPSSQLLDRLAALVALPEA